MVMLEHIREQVNTIDGPKATTFFGSLEATHSMYDLSSAIAEVTRSHDSQYGGFSSAPEFPIPVVM